MAPWKLSAGEKNVADTLLALGGTGFGYLSANWSHLPVAYQLLAAIAGFAGGYFISDLTSEIDTGIAPTVATIEVQAAAVWNQIGKPAAIQFISTLPAADQPIATALLATLNSRIPATATVTVVPMVVPSAAAKPVTAPAVIVEAPK